MKVSLMCGCTMYGAWNGEAWTLSYVILCKPHIPLVEEQLKVIRDTLKRAHKPRMVGGYLEDELEA